MSKRVLEAVASGFAAAGDGSASGMRWRVVLIREGMSLNDTYYPGRVLEEAVPLFERAPACVYKLGEADEDLGHIPVEVYSEVRGALLGNVVGHYENVRAENIGGQRCLTADLVLDPGAEVLGAKFRTWADAGWMDGGPSARMGLSVDVEVDGDHGTASGQRAFIVSRVIKVNSTDVVLSPAAGGSFQRLVASRRQFTQHGADGRNTMALKAAVKNLIAKAKGADVAARVTEGVADKALGAVLTANLKGTRATEGGGGAMVSKILKAIEAEQMDVAVALLETLAEMLGEEPAKPADAPVEAVEAAPVLSQQSVDRAIEAGIAKALGNEAKRATEATNKAARVEALIHAANLSDASEAGVRAQFEGAESDPAAVERAIKAARITEARMAEAIPSEMLGLLGRAPEGTVEAGLESNEKIAIAFDKAMGIDPSRLRDDYGTANVGRITEAVAKRQQTRAIKGLFVGGGTLDEARARYDQVPTPQSFAELAPWVLGVSATADRDRLHRATESARTRLTPLYRGLRTGVICPTTSPKRRAEQISVTQSILSTALSSSAHRKLLLEYRTLPDYWQSFVNVQSVPDFKETKILQYGHLPNLTKLANDQATYTDLISNTARTEESTTMKLDRYGNLLGVTEVALKNDDLKAIDRTIRQLAEAFKRTHEVSAHDALLAYTAGINDTVYAADGLGLVLYHATHANLVSAALTSTSLSTAVSQMFKQVDPQTGGGVQVLGIRGRTLIVPPELEGRAFQITRSEFVPENANNAKNPHYERFAVQVDPYLRADADNAYLVADPNEVQGVTGIYLDGVTEPWMGVQNDDLNGNVFTADEIRYKIKGAWQHKPTDCRGMQAFII